MINSNILLIEFSKKVYTLDELIKAHHYISDLAIMNIEESEDSYRCKLEAICENYSLDEVNKKFRYQLSREQVKSILNRENHKIRDLIVQQAFKPIENLFRVIDEV